MTLIDQPFENIINVNKIACKSHHQSEFQWATDEKKKRSDESTKHTYTSQKRPLSQWHEPSITCRTCFLFLFLQLMAKWIVCRHCCCCSSFFPLFSFYILFTATCIWLILFCLDLVNRRYKNSCNVVLCVGFCYSSNLNAAKFISIRIRIKHSCRMFYKWATWTPKNQFQPKQRNTTKKNWRNECGCWTMQKC